MPSGVMSLPARSSMIWIPLPASANPQAGPEDIRPTPQRGEDVIGGGVAVEQTAWPLRSMASRHIESVSKSKPVSAAHSLSVYSGGSSSSSSDPASDSMAVTGSSWVAMSTSGKSSRKSPAMRSLSSVSDRPRASSRVRLMRAERDASLRLSIHSSMDLVPPTSPPSALP